MDHFLFNKLMVFIHSYPPKFDVHHVVLAFETVRSLSLILMTEVVKRKSMEAEAEAVKA